MIETVHLHPMIVHFPIALILAGFLADLIYVIKKEKWWSNAGFFLMIVGTLGALAAFTTGILFTGEPTEGDVVPIYRLHTRAAFITVTLMVIVSVIRIRFFLKHKEDRFRWPVFILFLLGAIAVSYTGMMGGIMVYTYFLGL